MSKFPTVLIEGRMVDIPVDVQVVEQGTVENCGYNIGELRDPLGQPWVVTQISAYDAQKAYNLQANEIVRFMDQNGRLNVDKEDLCDNCGNSLVEEDYPSYEEFQSFDSEGI